MALPRTVTQAEFGGELARFEQLLRSIDPDDWDRPSVCEGWSGGDVAKHVVGQFADVVAGRFDGLGSAEATQREVDERKGRAPVEVADELAALVPSLDALLGMFDDDAWSGPSPNGTGTLGQGIEALWSDMILHADDIRDAIGRDADADVDVKAAISHVADVLTANGWTPTTIALDGYDEFPVSGGGPRITGSAWPFLRAATGRGDATALGLDPGINIYG
jgi:uncharacterized protein (TIGR03083 family)